MRAGPPRPPPPSSWPRPRCSSTEGEGNVGRATELADRLIEQSPGTKSGRIAHLVKGDALLKQNDAEGAIASYRTYLAKDTVIRYFANRRSVEWQ